MQPHAQPTQEGPLHTPKAFRRLTGAHAIIASLLLADLAGFLLAMFIGALIGSPFWWLLHAGAHLLHRSLVLDIGLILILFCAAMGYFRLRMLKKDTEDAWGYPGTIIILIGTTLLILFFVKTSWMTIPALAIPNVSLEPLSWSSSLMLLGGATAAGLSLLAHLVTLARAHHEPEEQLRSYARAHPDGEFWLYLEQAYAFYRRALARFNPPPITCLRTPATFYYYQRQTTNPDILPNPEREIYWVNGNLVINQAYIGPRKEQAELLLPFVARLLYDENSPDRIVQLLFRFAHVGDTQWLSAWFLFVPIAVAQECEKRWETMEPDHVLDRDRFAFDCGEGKRLRKWLQAQLAERFKNDQPDNAIPTLAERIEHLGSLLGREARQVKELREGLLAPPTSPTPQENA